MKLRIASLAFAATIVLGGCSAGARNEAAEAAETITADANATMGEAVSDVDAATNQAFGKAESAMNSASADRGNAQLSASEIDE